MCGEADPDLAAYVSGSSPAPALFILPWVGEFARPCDSHQVIAETRYPAERGAKLRQHAIKALVRDMREIAESHAKALEAGSLELPGEVFSRVLENVAVAAFAGEIEVVEQLATADEVEDVPEPVQVWCRAQQQPPWRSTLRRRASGIWPGTGRCSITSEKKITSNRRSVGGSSTARFIRTHQSVSAEVGEAVIFDVCDAGAIAPPQPTR
jgi:hypothetical protein